MTFELFNELNNAELLQEQLEQDVFILRRFMNDEKIILSELRKIISQAPFRHMYTPSGYKMSVAMTNCGSVGWIADQKGYRYSAVDPNSGKPWPNMPDVFFNLAVNAAIQTGFTNFKPDVCLINRYEPGAKMSLHQDKDEKDFTAPIVSLSLGIPAVFLWGGMDRKVKPRRILLTHGDILVWGGLARLRYHGVMPIKENTYPLLGKYRFNLTFRKAV